MNYTESTKGLVVVSCNTTYELTGYRYFDMVNFTYWYESTSGIWMLGDSMRYADGRIR